MEVDLAEDPEAASCEFNPAIFEACKLIDYWLSYVNRGPSLRIAPEKVLRHHRPGGMASTTEGRVLV